MVSNTNEVPKNVGIALAGSFCLLLQALVYCFSFLSDSSRLEMLLFTVMCFD